MNNKLAELAAPAPDAASTLAEESALLARAVQALHAGHAAAARTMLLEHTERFPHGLLARERELALARLGAARKP